LGNVSIGCALLLTASSGAEAKDKAKPVAVQVSCVAAQSVNEALQTKADELTIEISGLCEESVR
jgi:hypothetical protein